MKTIKGTKFFKKFKGEIHNICVYKGRVIIAAQDGIYIVENGKAVKLLPQKESVNITITSGASVELNLKPRGAFSESLWMFLLNPVWRFICLNFLFWMDTR